MPFELPKQNEGSLRELSEVTIGQKLELLEGAVSRSVLESMEAQGISLDERGRHALHVAIREAVWKEGCDLFKIDPSMLPFDPEDSSFKE